MTTTVSDRGDSAERDATTVPPLASTSEADLVADRYELGPPLGSGAMATVFRAFDQRLQRPVAIKLLAPQAVRGSARFHREACLAARLNHPNIVPVYDIGSHRNNRFIVMECVEGVTLQDLVRRQGVIPAYDARRYVSQIARGVGFAHEEGVIHRDLKPQNVMLERYQDRIMVVDFGLACAIHELGMMTGTGVLGTPMYMSPEQARGEDIDARSDLFSIGLIQYYLIVGEPLFAAPSLPELIRQHEQQRIDNALGKLAIPDVDRELLQATLRIDRSERIPDARPLM